MNRKQVLQAIQSRAARIAVGASTVRGRGNAGTVRAARRFLRRLDLRAFGHAAPASFGEALNASTEALRAKLPPGARCWGIARKVLNIFLRDCLYTTYLEAAFHLRRQEGLFELPLDSIAARLLKRAAGRGKLPAWSGVRHLTREAQSSASLVSQATKFHDGASGFRPATRGFEL